MERLLLRLNGHGPFSTSDINFVKQLISRLGATDTKHLLQQFSPSQTNDLGGGAALLGKLETALGNDGIIRLLEIYSHVKDNQKVLLRIVGEYLCNNSIDVSNWP